MPNLSTRCVSFASCLALTLAALLPAGGCQKPVLLKKYVATAPASPGGALAGRRIFVEPFVDANDPSKEWEDSESLEDPMGWTYVELLDEHIDAWEAERDAIMERVPEAQWYKLGHQRNAWGIPVRDVMAVNGPAEWITEAVRVELGAQGAVLVDDPAGAEAVVRGTLRNVRIDAYMATWCNIVVDVNVVPAVGETVASRIHTSGSRVAWDNSAEESYDVMRHCEQKLIRYLLPEVERALPARVPAS